MNGAVAVLGPGAVGGALAVRLALARNRVICVARPSLIPRLWYAGLTLESDGTTLAARPEAVERLEQPVSLLLVTVKAPALDEALDRIDPAAISDAVVLPLLNGLEHMEPLRARFDGHVAAGSISRFIAYRAGPVQVVQTSPTAVVKMASTDVPDAKLERVAELLRLAKIEAWVEEDEKRVLWEKAARLSVLSAATVATGRTMGELRDDPRWRPRLENAIEEACAVAEADGVPLRVGSQWAIIDELPREFTTSTARDAAVDRTSELDAIAGAVLRAGERLGVPCPTLSEIVADARGR
jgi:2-dehydropantoate 2-reductase